MNIWIRYETYLDLNRNRTVEDDNPRDLHEFGMKLVNTILGKVGRYSTGLVFNYNVFDKELFFLAKIKYGIELVEFTEIKYVNQIDRKI